MSFYSRYKTDETAETGGVWVDFGDGVEVKVARLSNKHAVELNNRLRRPYQHLPEIPRDVGQKIMREVCAKAVVKDWKGVTDEAGREIPFSVEHAMKVFVDLPDFLNDIVTAAQDRDIYKAEADKAAEGNSVSSSAGQ